MKPKRISVIMSLLLAVLLIAACSRAQDSAGPAWREQYDLGMRYLSQGNYQEAVIAFQAAIDIDPRSADAHVGLGQAYVGLGEHQSAAGAFQTAIGIDSGLVEAYLGLAEAYVGLGDMDAALDALREGYEATNDERLLRRMEELLNPGGAGGDGAQLPPDWGDYRRPELTLEERLAQSIYENPDFVSPDELTINGVPFYDAELDWVLSSFSVYGIYESEHLNSNSEGRLTYWIYIPGRYSAESSLMDDWFNGIHINTDPGRNGSRLSSMSYGGSGLSDNFYPMEMPPEVRGIAGDDTIEEFLNKLGVSPDDSEALRADGHKHIDLRMFSSGGYSLRFDELDVIEDFEYWYAFWWFFEENGSFYHITLNALFNESEQLKWLTCSYETMG